MAKFSIQFDLGMSQQALDFVDIDPPHDTKLYVDPYAIEIRNDVWSNKASEYIRGFFEEVLNALRAKDETRVINLMSHLQEPRETFLGVSRGRSKGRGVGSVQARQLVNSIRKSPAFASGLLSDLSEMSLYVEMMDRDKISDLTTNVIRFLLVDYTQQQCDLHGIETQNYMGPPGWNNEMKNWESRAVQLPYIGQMPILLVPKFAVRKQLCLNSQEFYNHQITDFLVAEQYRATSSLVHTLKGGKQKVYKGEVREKYPKSKPLIVKIVEQHPELLDTYKQAAKRYSIKSFSDDDPTVQEVCRAFAQELTACPTGRDHADAYHKLMTGILTLLFYPELIQPHREWEIHDGRKRIDIVFTNSGDTGFFSQRRDANNTQANLVIIECKNYSSDIGNQELDQLLGRFDGNRGKLGIITCRKVDDEQRLLARCRDASTRSIGFIITLTDAEILAMLKAKENLRDEEIDYCLQAKFRELLR